MKIAVTASPKDTFLRRSAMFYGSYQTLKLADPLVPWTILRKLRITKGEHKIVKAKHSGRSPFVSSCREFLWTITIVPNVIAICPEISSRWAPNNALSRRKRPSPIQHCLGLWRWHVILSLVLIRLCYEKYGNFFTCLLKLFSCLSENSEKRGNTNREAV